VYLIMLKQLRGQLEPRARGKQTMKKLKTKVCRKCKDEPSKRNYCMDCGSDEE